MALRVDWYYHRPNCTTCSKSLAFLTEKKAVIAAQENASKRKYSPDEALKMAREADELFVAKGKKVLHFPMQPDPPADADLLKALIGPSGNLRAPVVRLGKKLFVGFHAEEFAPHFAD